MKKRNVLTLVLALVLVAALAVGGTLAYFTDKDEASNTFTMGKVDIDLKESNDGGDSWDQEGLDYADVLPGATTPKMACITVENGSADCFIMVDVQIDCNDLVDGKGFSAEDKNALLDAIKVAINPKDEDGNEIDPKWRFINPSENGFQCVYYTGNDGEESATSVSVDDTKPEPLHLFDEIEIPASFKNNVAEEKFTIALKAYAIQSDNVEYTDGIWATNFQEPQA